MKMNKVDETLNEIWKEVTLHGYTYEVSNKGNVKLNGKLTSQTLSHDGYKRITIRANTKSGWSGIGVSRLVAMAFIVNDDPLHKKEVNHKDFNRANNCVENLEWCTREYNVRYSICNKPDMKGDKNPNYGNRKLSEIYKNNKEYSKEKQSRPNIQNGRATKVEMYDLYMQYIKTFSYLIECFQWLIDNGYTTAKTVEGVRGRFNSCYRNSLPYKGFYFKKIIKE